MSSFKDIVWSEIKGLRPSFVSKKPHFNFISTHYFWIIGCTIIGSVLIYGPGKGNIKYIDALSFAAGGSTQAGLNTIDVNKLNTFQQVVLYFLAAMTNPITVNSFVVLLRLFWFEKRFQHIVQEARLRRGTLSKSKTQLNDEVSRAERGVNGRHITVMHNGAKSRMANDGTYLGPLGVASDGALDQTVAHTADNTLFNTGSEPPDFNHLLPPKVTVTEPLSEPLENRREISFAPAVKRSDGLSDDTLNLPVMHSSEEHIAILERQRRNQNDDEVLRIPGPREADRGILPSRVVRGESDCDNDDDDDDDNDVPSPHRPRSVAPPSSTRSDPLPGSDPASVHDNSGHPSGASSHRSSTSDSGGDNANGNATADGLPARQAITIQEPDKPSRREEFEDDAAAVVNLFGSLGLRWPDRLRMERHRRKPIPRLPTKYRTRQESSGKTSTASRIRRRHTFSAIRTALTRGRDDPAPYLSWQPTLGRNSAFVGLSEEQREELGGIEYRSLKTLAIVLFCYFWGFSVLGIICLVPWILRDSSHGKVVNEAGMNRTWWGLFTAHSAFTDLGFTLTPDSMNSFSTAVFPLLLMSFLIVIGNTGFPVMLRFVIWITALVTPRGSGLYEELKFLLDHPRRCFTLLFPSGATWWLFWLLVILNGIDLLFFIILDLGNGPINSLPPGIRVLDGLFQAFATRTAGFSCVNLAQVHPAVQASYMIMMYISVFPIAISVRRTNVYEENSLGIYNGPDESDEPQSGSELEYVGAHLRRQLSFDLWFISIGFFILTISEGKRLQRDDFSMFAVLFEVISAYGTVGLSLGYPTVNSSLCSQFTVIGKLVIIAMMIRGRHRGLPYGLDRAILLPSESLNAKEAADANARNPGLIQANTRRASIQSQATQAPTIRPSTTTRRSMDRVNSNLISHILHPGPSMARNSMVGQGPSLRRSFTDTVYEDSAARATGADLRHSQSRT